MLFRSSGGVLLDGDLRVPPQAAGIVIFAHGSGSSRFSRRNREVAEALEGHGFATLLLDLIAREAPAFRVGRFDYRAASPLFAGMPFSVNGRRGPGDRPAQLWAAGPTGALAMEGQVEELAP